MAGWLPNPLIPGKLDGTKVIQKYQTEPRAINLFANLFESGKLDFLFTIPETNIAHENKPSQKEHYLPTIHF